MNEYLQLAASADKQQLQRIKAVFEKKNQKSAHTISQLQKKLDNYQKRMRDFELHGVAQSHRPPREVLRDMGQGLRWVLCAECFENDYVGDFGFFAEMLVGI